MKLRYTWFRSGTREVLSELVQILFQKSGSSRSECFFLWNKYISEIHRAYIKLKCQQLPGDFTVVSNNRFALYYVQKLKIASAIVSVLLVIIFLYKGHTTVIYKNMSRIGRIGIFAGNPALIKLKQPEDPPFTVRAKAAFSLLV